MASGDLPAGVRLIACGSDEDNPDELHAIYDVHGWRVVVQWQIAAPLDGPTFLRVQLDEEGLDQTVGTDGITAGVLRSIPLAHSRRLMGQMKAAQLQGTPEAAELDLPARVESRRDYARVARAYADLVSRGHRHPLMHLQRASGTDRNTWSSRIRRARDMGLLTRPPDAPALTETGRRALEGHEGK
jgi:hypothetical protein